MCIVQCVYASMSMGALCTARVVCMSAWLCEQQCSELEFVFSLCRRFFVLSELHLSLFS
jgi:hypothetical protein